MGCLCKRNDKELFVKRKSMYETSDGRTIADRKDATEHEKWASMLIAVGQQFPELDLTDMEQVGKVADFLKPDYKAPSVIKKAGEDDSTESDDGETASGEAAGGTEEGAEPAAAPSAENAPGTAANF